MKVIAAKIVPNLILETELISSKSTWHESQVYRYPRENRTNENALKTSPEHARDCDWPHSIQFFSLEKKYCTLFFYFIIDKVAEKWSHVSDFWRKATQTADWREVY